MKRKTIALVLILVIVTIILTGCAPMPKYEEEKEKKDDNKMFMVVEDYDGSRVIVDKETNVMYWESWAGSSYGILTLLVDKDGKPKIWNGGK